MSTDDIAFSLKRSNTWDRIVVDVTTILFLLTIIFVTMQIVVRNVINNIGTFSLTLTWTEPAARMALVIGAFWGAAVASRNKEHIVITFPLQKIREKSNHAYIACRILIGTVVISYSAIIFYGMFQKTVTQWHTTFSGLAAIPGGVVFLIISISLLLMTIYEVWNVVNEFYNKDPFKEKMDHDS